MNQLGFFQPIKNNDDFHLKKIEFFDGYFALSGKRYKIISQTDITVKNYSVKETHEKPSYLLNALKVASYFTGIIPLIMLVGKAISRSGYHFSIRDYNVNALDKKPEYDVFRQNAINNLQNKDMHRSSLNCNFDNHQKQELLAAHKHKDHPNIQEFHGKRIYGGVNQICFFNAIPGHVFKIMNDKKDAENYLKIVNAAQNIVDGNQLHLLKVPATEIVEIDGRFFIAQENLDLMHSKYRDQRGLYQYCWTDPQLEAYMEELFSQLLTFTCLMKFSDFKYDNIPLTTSGKAGLIDIDNLNTNTGLFHGGSRYHDGLFHYLPPNQLNPFADKARKLMGGAFNEGCFQNAEKRVTKKHVKNTCHLQFIEAHPKAEIDLKIVKTFKRRDRKDAALIINEINKKLSKQQNNPCQIEARRVEINVEKLFSKRKISPEKKVTEWKKSILPQLLNAECIHRHRVDKYYPNVIILHC